MNNTDGQHGDGSLTPNESTAPTKDVFVTVFGNDTGSNSPGVDAGAGDISCTTTKKCSFLCALRPCATFKYVYSTLLLVFSIAIVVSLIFDGQTPLAQQLHSTVAFFVLCMAVLWLSVLEGGQGALVGLVPVPKSLYSKSHPLALQCATLAHSGNHMERFLTGRQFLVFLLVFVTNECGAPVDADAAVWNLPTPFQQTFVRSSLALILMTAMVGQLHTQVTSSSCMLDFINNRVMLITLYVSLAVEASGLCHASYLLQMIFSKLSSPKASGKASARSVEQDEGNGFTRNICQQVLFWVRVVFSVLFLFLAFAVTLTALYNSQTLMWEGVPASVSVVIFIGLMILLGLLEGTQIAVFAVSRLPKEELSRHSKNVSRCVDLLLGKNHGHNVARFMIGRQILVTLLSFVLARITAINVDFDNGEATIWGVPRGVQIFFNTGLMGAIIITLLASISWRLLGSSFPILYLSNPLIYVLINVCLGLEASGLCSGAWVLAAVHRKCAGLHPDDIYVGTPQDWGALPSSSNTETEITSA